MVYGYCPMLPREEDGHVFTHLVFRTFASVPQRADDRHSPMWRSLNADERNPGLPNPHRAGGLTRHISYISTESSFKVNTTCMPRFKFNDHVRL